jgi:hypothetical protein
MSARVSPTFFTTPDSAMNITDFIARWLELKLRESSAHLS